MSYQSGGLYTDITVKGNQITDVLKRTYKKLKTNDIVSFEEIKAIGPDGITVSLSPLTLKVK
jgi:ABC-type transporter Mla maintaining outer membrane lipid asymmetry ATPase subunit MlaF